MLCNACLAGFLHVQRSVVEGLFFLPQLQKGVLSSAPTLTAKSFRMFLSAMPHLTDDYKLAASLKLSSLFLFGLFLGLMPSV